MLGAACELCSLEPLFPALCIPGYTCMCVQAAKALTRLRIRAVMSEPLLAAYARSTVLRCRGSNWMILLIALQL